ncbi:hypothetical protein SNEBB_004009 [Seison nebaliae]|nr:hypothetical protein SNEBB_004009 [Seison nebaliae]
MNEKNKKKYLKKGDEFERIHRRLERRNGECNSTIKTFSNISYLNKMKNYGLNKKELEIILDEHRINKLYEWQDECLNKSLQLTSNIIITLPTSSGKTLVAEIILLQMLLHGNPKRHVLLVLPYVAIVEEKVKEFVNLMRKVNLFNIGEYAGGKGTIPPPDNLLTSVKDVDSKKTLFICTYEKGNALLNYLWREDRAEDIGLVVIDELHMIGKKLDEQSHSFNEILSMREMLLECFVSKLQFKRIRTIAMSATIDNTNELCQFMNDAFLYESNFRPIQLEENIIIVESGKKIFFDEKSERFVENSETHLCSTSLSDIFYYRFLLSRIIRIHPKLFKRKDKLKFREKINESQFNTKIMRNSTKRDYSTIQSINRRTRPSKNRAIEKLSQLDGMREENDELDDESIIILPKDKLIKITNPNKFSCTSNNDGVTSFCLASQVIVRKKVEDENEDEDEDFDWLDDKELKDTVFKPNLMDKHENISDEMKKENMSENDENRSKKCCDDIELEKENKNIIVEDELEEKKVELNKCFYEEEMEKNGNLINSNDDNIIVCKLIAEIYPTNVIIFCATKKQCEKLCFDISDQFTRSWFECLERIDDLKKGRTFQTGDNVKMGTPRTKSLSQLSVIIGREMMDKRMSLLKMIILLMAEEKDEIREKNENIRSMSKKMCGIMRTAILYAGCAYHHAGVSSTIRTLLEDSFREGVLTILCSTTTISTGVNLPASRVIIRSIRDYKSQFSTTLLDTMRINMSLYKQMIGRAGRQGVKVKTNIMDNNEAYLSIDLPTYLQCKKLIELKELERLTIENKNEEKKKMEKIPEHLHPIINDSFISIHHSNNNDELKLFRSMINEGMTYCQSVLLQDTRTSLLAEFLMEFIALFYIKTLDDSFHMIQSSTLAGIQTKLNEFQLLNVIFQALIQLKKFSIIEIFYQVDKSDEENYSKKFFQNFQHKLTRMLNEKLNEIQMKTIKNEILNLSSSIQLRITPYGLSIFHSQLPYYMIYSLMNDINMSLSSGVQLHDHFHSLFLFSLIPLPCSSKGRMSLGNCCLTKKYSRIQPSFIYHEMYPLLSTKNKKIIDSHFQLSESYLISMLQPHNRRIDENGLNLFSQTFLSAYRANLEESNEKGREISDLEFLSMVQPFPDLIRLNAKNSPLILIKKDQLFDIDDYLSNMTFKPLNHLFANNSSIDHLCIINLQEIAQDENSLQYYYYINYSVYLATRLRLRKFLLMFPLFLLLNVRWDRERCIQFFQNMSNMPNDMKKENFDSQNLKNYLNSSSMFINSLKSFFTSISQFRSLQLSDRYSDQFPSADFDCNRYNRMNLYKPILVLLDEYVQLFRFAGYNSILEKSMTISVRNWNYVEVADLQLYKLYSQHSKEEEILKLTDIPCVTYTRLSLLLQSNIYNIDDLARCSVEKLMEILKTIRRQEAVNIIATAKLMVKEVIDLLRLQMDKLKQIDI